MIWARMGIRLMGATGVICALLATSTIWLLLTSPAAMTTALDRGTIAPLARELAIALVNVFRGLLAYL